MENCNKYTRELERSKGENGGGRLRNESWEQLGEGGQRATLLPWAVFV